MKTVKEIEKIAMTKLTDEERRLIDSDETYFDNWEIDARVRASNKLLAIEKGLGIDSAIMQDVQGKDE